MKRIVDYLASNAQQFADKFFIYDLNGDYRLTYSEFWQLVKAESQDMIERGWHRGDALCIRSSQTAAYLVKYFACHLLGVVVVPLEHDLPEERVEEINIRLRAVQKHLPDCHFPSDMSDILFTSGTTGKPKGVVLTHQALVSDAVNLTDSQGFHHDLVFIINGPLNHAGCWTKVLPVVMAGASLFLMPGMKSLDAFYESLDFVRGLGNVRAATFLVPASIRMLLQFSADRLAAYADVIEFIETGAAPMPQSDMLRLCELLPQSRLYNTYASSETGVVSTYNYNDGKCISGCLGKPMKLARIVLRDGLLVCSGPAIMRGYLEKSDLTKPGITEFETSDLARFDENGNLYLIGRQNDVINVGGLKVSPVEVEETALSFEGVADCICIPEPHPVMGFIPKLLVVMEPGAFYDKRALAQYMKQRLEAYKVPVKYEQTDHIERTYNGKLNRKAYIKQ